LGEGVEFGEDLAAFRAERVGGVEVFNTVLGSAVDALDFKMNRLLERDPNPSIEATRRIIDSVLGIMAGAPEQKSRFSQVKQELIDLGANAALMSGSGSTVFAIFDNDRVRDVAAETLRGSGWWSSSVRTVGRSEYRAAYV